ncbi:MAG: helix-turn-helix domain-containing protein [Oscillospiraceae bacterium]|nr:helix-turn-helix domain-containing protein [Oscillospiraceae bacterium]
MKRRAKDLVYNWDTVPVVVDPHFVAVIMGCSDDKVRKECQNGTLPAFKFGGMWRIRREDLIAYTKGEKFD